MPSFLNLALPQREKQLDAWDFEAEAFDRPWEMNFAHSLTKSYSFDWEA